MNTKISSSFPSSSCYSFPFLLKFFLSSKAKCILMAGMSTTIYQCRENSITGSCNTGFKCVWIITWREINNCVLKVLKGYTSILRHFSTLLFQLSLIFGKERNYHSVIKSKRLATWISTESSFNSRHLIQMVKEPQLHGNQRSTAVVKCVQDWTLWQTTSIQSTKSHSNFLRSRLSEWLK